MRAAVRGVGAVRALPRRAGADERRRLQPRGPRPDDRGAASGVRARSPPSAMRMELIAARSPSRLALPESLVEQRLRRRRGRARRARRRRATARARAGAGEGRRGAQRARGDALPGARTPSGRSSRCASPRRRRARGRSRGLDLEEHFSSELLRRAAAQLRAGDLREPMADRARRARPRGRPGASARCSPSSSSRPGASARTRRCSRCSACSSSWRASTAQIQRARAAGGADASSPSGERVKREFDRARRVLEETGEGTASIS